MFGLELAQGAKEIHNVFALLSLLMRQWCDNQLITGIAPLCI